MSITNDEIKKYWNGQKELVESILIKGFRNYVNANDRISGEFISSFIKSDSICCIDERVKEEGLHSAGSGIAYILNFLDQANEKSIREVIDLAVDNAVADFKSFQPSKIFTHEGCGAENLVYGKLVECYGNEGMETFKEPSQLGFYWANEVAKKLNIQYSGRLEVEPAEFHIARVIYYDATGLFTHRSVKKGSLPQGFVLSRKYMNKAQCMAETNVAIGIATGDHGFGDLINSQDNNQLILVGLGDIHNPSLSEEIIKNELEEIAGGYSGKVVVHTVTPELQ